MDKSRFYNYSKDMNFYITSKAGNDIEIYAGVYWNVSSEEEDVGVFGEYVEDFCFDDKAQILSGKKYRDIYFSKMSDDVREKIKSHIHYLLNEEC